MEASPAARRQVPRICSSQVSISAGWRARLSAAAVIAEPCLVAPADAILIMRRYGLSGWSLEFTASQSGVNARKRFLRFSGSLICSSKLNADTRLRVRPSNCRLLARSSKHEYRAARSASYCRSVLWAFLHLLGGDKVEAPVGKSCRLAPMSLTARASTLESPWRGRLDNCPTNAE